MRISLRTRLFAAVAVVIAGSIGISALLTRRATLVEVREFVGKPGAPIEPGVAARIREHVAGRGLDGIGGLLSALEREISRGLLLVVAESRAVIAASNPELATARVQRASPEGLLSAQVSSGSSLSQLEVRGGPPLLLTDPRSGQTGLLFMLPQTPGSGAIRLVAIAPWIMTTVATIALALLLAFALSRRVLEPVTALTEAARRMEAGDLTARVAHEERGGDEITELGRAFNRMAARLAQTERLRRQMVSDVAHELRSPVTNLRCHVEAMQDGLLPLDREALDVLHEETLFLQRLITDLQDLTLAEAGRLDVRGDHVDVAEIARRAATPFAAAPGALVSVRVEPGPTRVLGDEARLEQVLRNLLSNARRHTPADGRIEVVVAGRPDRVAVTVRDTGEGIAADHLPHLFDRFYRADESRSRSTGGAGLGLAIARQLVTAHRGTIRVDSDGRGYGSAFTIELPAAQASSAV